ncbi:unnamed protein product, partial [Meganyctiphanes norvegica]
KNTNTKLYNLNNNSPLDILRNVRNNIMGHFGSMLNDSSPVKSISKSDEKSTTMKIILFWNTWYGYDWSARFSNYTNLHEQGCPSWRCEFTYNKSRLHEADAVVFKSDLCTIMYGVSVSHMWTVLAIESLAGLYSHKYHPISKLIFRVNWTMTYHRNADITAFYGYLLALNQTLRN